MTEGVVKMVRDATAHPDSHEANVREENVSGFEALGWNVATGAATADLADLTVAALRDLAAERGVDLGDAKKKPDIIAALELAAEAATDREVMLDATHDDAGGLSIRQLNADLMAREIEIDPRHTPAEKFAILNEAE